ncbi:MAG: imidazole glycerol phosphate synthase subunit HisF [Candidatus Harrisonbacteria bacterium CG10_big_fil_rev_8_21_14_0_10_42_17]|uniref:imidazole glycerol-phosphate synthase n=1 Tax=Candidatus Harrisonbacteria bacterium CG10_big_fil_rev_8_21_14_0_10_42_17 TaxID=1974584 RepID=A0A2M6WIF9_9BACT|nr:MAG: imidazole glycerol phosphate synthase subunit HisF [Candidatus Harrisonbacteria bacterium CG10_big_fil_rev_8_21_14_0_10_42_17]
MLHKRLIGCLTIKNNIVVQSIGFHKYLPVGRLDIAVEFLNRWGIDEIMILDIDATQENCKPNIPLLYSSTQKNFTPLGVGGGITSIEDMRKLNYLGVEKVVLNTMAIENPNIIKQATEIFGNQFVVVSLDVKKNKSNRYEIFTHGGTKATGLDPVKIAKQVADLGAGEILLTSIDRDGSQKGYDIELIESVASRIPIPLIACGGVGHPIHLHEGFQAGASACAAGNFFHFTEHSPVIVKAYLRERGVAVRIDTTISYDEAGFLENGRLAKRDQDYLEELRFQIVIEESI